ncbi:MAG: rRNA pseudouridine synthase [Leptospiraceae bacterium]|nr:rRNA pseudouridine synthase [Leptospiraceae bacterium]
MKLKEDAGDEISRKIQKVRKILLDEIREPESPFFKGKISEQDDSNEPIRINRFLSKSGLGARRTVEKLILDGKIKINGEVITSLSKKVFPGDKVTLNEDEIAPVKGKVILAFNKPKGYLCSHKDVHHDKTVFNLLPSQFSRLNMAGRLDLSSRGLMIFSSDGDLIQRLSHPTGGIEKIYKVQLSFCPEESELVSIFLKGVEEGGEFLRAKNIEVIDRNEKLVRITLKEGKKRQIHRMFQTLGIKVLDLQRIIMGKLNLDELSIKEGEFKQIEETDILEDVN